MNTDTPQTIDRSIPPLSGQPKDVRFPEYFEQTLANGLKLIVYERTKLPTVSFHIVAHGGSSFDAAMPGRATMMAELLTKGTGTRKATEIVEQIEYYGASLGSGAGWDSCSVGVSLLSKHLEPVAEVLADIVRNATFPEEELERLRRQRLASILQRKANPSALAYDQFIDSPICGQRRQALRQRRQRRIHNGVAIGTRCRTTSRMPSWSSSP